MMYLYKLMRQRRLSRRDLVRMSGIPDSTLRDILNGTSHLANCKAGTLIRLAEALDLTAEELLALSHEEYMVKQDADTVPQSVHAQTPLVDFFMIVEAAVQDLQRLSAQAYILSADHGHWIESLLDKFAYREALFILGLIDYLCRKSGMKPNPVYEPLRKLHLDEAVYSLDTLQKGYACGACARVRGEAEMCSIPELARHNIYLTPEDIRMKA